MNNALGVPICGKCKEELPKDGDHCFCRLCGVGFHFGDCSLRSQSWKGLGKAGQEKWICVSCRKKEKSKSQSEVDPIENVPLDLVSKINSLLEMKDTIARIEKAMSFHSGQYDEILGELRKIREENKEVKKELAETKNKLKNSEEQVQILADRVNELDQYGRRMNLEIHGVPIHGPSLESEKIEDVVQKLAQEINVPFEVQKIHKMHRLQKRTDERPPAILIQFMSVTTRDQWLQAGKKARLTEKNTDNKIFFNENLTLVNKGLLREAKIRAKMYGYRFVWFQGGKVLVKKNQEDRNIIAIKRMEDVNKIGK